MNFILQDRLNELELSNDERDFIIENIDMFNKVYLRGVRDTALSMQK